MEIKEAEGSPQPAAERQGARQRQIWINRTISLSIVLMVLAITVLVVVFRRDLWRFRSYGYVGVFLVNLVASASLVVPVPALAVVFALGGILDPLLVGVLSAIGATLGEVTGYLLGYGGRGVMEHVRLYPRMEAWMKKRGWLVIIVLAFVPNPFFDIAGAAAGALRFPLWKFFLYSGIGKLGKSLLFAYGGVWGLQEVLRWLR